jgi:CRISPR-associated protein Cas1
MPPLYVVQQGSKIRISNRRVQIDLEGEVLASMPLGQVSQVVLFGNIGLTTPAICRLLEDGIEVVFLSRRGRFKGRLVGSVTPHVPLRRAQYACLRQPDFVLGMAQGFVGAKLAHMRALLLRHNRERKSTEIVNAAQRIHASLESLPRKTKLSGLVGLEGSATAAYFRGYRQLFTSEWRFKTRNRRPPKDPVNVLLSFGYTLITQLATSAARTVGLDPYAGFLHELAYNRPALGLDLVEEFRPVVDGIILWCCNSGQVTPEDFSSGSPERPVVLSEQGQRIFLKAFEERMQQRYTHPLRDMRFSMRQCIIEQARQIALRIQEGSPGYQGMGFR